MQAPAQRYKITVMGDGGVGKTATTLAFCKGVFVEEYDPTIEDSYMKQVKARAKVDGQDTLFEILDTAGPEEFSALRDQWIRDTYLAVVIYSVMSRPSFEQTSVYIEQINRVKGIRQNANPALIVLVANKIDMRPVTPDAITREEGEALAKKLGATYFCETSAKTFQGIEEMFFECIRIIRRTGEPAKNEKASKCILC